MNKYALVTACVVALISQPARADHVNLGGGIGTSGPINTISAQTLPEGKFAIGFNTSFIKSKGFTDAELIDKAAQHIHAHSMDYMLAPSVSGSYGLTDDLTLSLSLPYVYREDIRAGHHSHGPAGNTVDSHGNSSGIGDITAMGMYRFYNNQDAGVMASALFGVKAPTGKKTESHNGEKLDAEHQPGSGSWDPLVGFALSKTFGKIGTDASILYANSTEGSQDTDLGDRISYNLAVSYRLGDAAGDEHNRHAVDATSGCPCREAWDLILEMNGEWMNEKEEGGVKDEDSGGNAIFISPGIRYTSKSNWSAHVGAGVPIVSNLAAGHADTDYRVTAGIGFGF